MKKRRKMKTKKTAFILYEYDQFNNDYSQVMEYYSINELCENNADILKIERGTRNKHLYQYISKDIEHVKRLINDRYLIIKEDLTK